MSAHHTEPAGRGEPVEIQLRGEVGDYALSLFRGFEHTVEAATTTVRGTVADEAELAELCRRIRDAGIELVSLRRLPQPGAGPGAGPVTGDVRREGVA